jgi:hypothetical protein
LNSAVHSYLILAYTDSDKVAMSVGFYYMANATGRLAGTVLSGALYQWGLQSGPSNGLIACLWASSAFVLVAGLLSLLLPRNLGPRQQADQDRRSRGLARQRGKGGDFRRASSRCVKRTRASPPSSNGSTRRACKKKKKASPQRCLLPSCGA